MSAGNNYQVGSYRVDADQKLLLRDEEIVPLTPKAFDLLLVLLQNNGRVVEKERLLNLLWPDTFVEEANVAKLVFQLRKTLGQGYIETVPKRGYRLLVPARRDEAGVVLDEQAVSRITIEAEERTAAPFRVFRWLATAVSVLVIVAAGLFWSRGRLNPSPQTIRSIIVMPLNNLSANPQDEYLSEGLTEELISTLTNVKGLRVASRTTAFHFRKANLDLREVGRNLGVEAAIEGSLRRDGSRLRISLQLISTRDGYQIWARSFERLPEGLFALQDEIAQAVAKSVGQHGSLPPPRRTTQSVEAYNLYLRGVHLSKKVAARSLRRSTEYLEKAVQKDPRFAAAHAALAFAYADMALLAQAPTPEVLSKATTSWKKALALDDSLPEAHIGKAWSLFGGWQWAEADQAFRRALELNPLSSQAHHLYAHLLESRGRLDEGMRETRRAIEIDPLDVQIVGHLGWHYYISRRYDEAIAASDDALEIDSSYTAALNFKSLAFREKGMLAESLEIDKRLGVAPEALGKLRRGVLTQGPQGFWREMLEAKLAAEREGGMGALGVADCYARLGMIARSLDWIERSVGRGDAVLVYLNISPWADSLRQHPRYAAVLRRIGLK